MKNKKEKKEWVKELLPYILILVGVILLKQFVITPIMVEGTSMYPTLEDGDTMILNRLKYKFSDIKRFDIIVVHDHKTYIIKRVIGLPGDEIKYINNKLYVNNKVVKENFSHAKTDDFNIKTLGKKKVPNNTYFVVGDNRINSLDSRTIGFIPKDEILGHTSLTIMPFSRFGNKK